MKRRIFLLAECYLVLLALFLLQRIVFMAWYHDLYAGISAGDWLAALRHGLPLDRSIAGYLCVIPGLLLTASCWLGSKSVRATARIYFGIVAFLLAAIAVVNIGLYQFWGFPLDATPLFYFFSSPADALASVSGWFIAGGIAAIIFYAAFIFCIFYLLWNQRLPQLRKPWPSAITLFLLTGLLLIPIRGGVTVSTMNTGKAYFSNNIRLNHAAVNPAFSLIESLGRTKDPRKQYRFMTDAEASRIFSSMLDPQAAGKAPGPASIDADTLFTSQKPDVVFVIMESFSNLLMHELGGLEDVAVNLDSLSHEGVLFTNFYANSFRTDRGLVAILSGYPAQPTMSIMKFPHKTQHLPSIASKLVNAGYDADYYYGGDADFTNMRSYLMSSGFSRIVSDVDFPVKERISKWGAPDHVVFRRFLDDYSKERPHTPRFRVIQTSSSHEPFDVPYQRLGDKRLNAFAYTDHCIGQFVKEMKRLPGWKNTVIVFVADHLGGYPENIDNFKEERYRIPLLITGGAVRRPMRVDTYASQHDIAATLLNQLGINHKEFVFSKDILDPQAPHFAFFTVPDAMGMADKSGTVIYDNQGAKTVLHRGTDADSLLVKAKAYLQKLYDDIATR